MEMDIEVEVEVTMEIEMDDGGFEGVSFLNDDFSRSYCHIVRVRVQPWNP